MNLKNTDDAVSGVRAQLERGGDIPAGQSFYTIKTNVVAFMCNKDNRKAGLTAFIFSAHLGTITDRCGRYISGAYQDGPTKNRGAIIVGYQRWSQGTDFCKGATSSPASSC
ncbi:hypothetical protein EJ04DRAFT_608882 [Polyplosphaeria fusca]|uniref:Uncharacterized protein n=1 Tax=Polyplosphaeria fusca TaxID=682080 RepID=A0A9P4QQZ6_9PLEO|nr:hypothetical protein EJ04DRAFT_608882 [Polyplosphaeria fusca]